jgi:hypothetical protein
MAGTVRCRPWHALNAASTASTRIRTVALAHFCDLIDTILKHEAEVHGLREYAEAQI